MTPREVVVYRWPDSCSVRAFQINDRDVRLTLCLLPDSRPMGIKLSIFANDAKDRILTSWSSGHANWPEDAERRVRGFALDLGAKRPDEERIGLVSNYTLDQHDVELAAYPRFVDDARWEDRYEEARSIFKDRVPSLFLGVVDSFYIGEEEDRPEDRRFITVWGEGGVVGSVEAATLEEVVDKSLRAALVLPESERLSWEAEHVLRGSFVLPSPDELEVFQLLGEPLPFWWGNERFYHWLWERA